jgi:hypothetical protein
MMVNRLACDACDYRIDFLTKDGPTPDCPGCGESLEFAGKVGCVRGAGEGQVPVRDLEALIEDWGDDKREPPARHPDIWRTYRNCAEELEELVGEVQDAKP